MHTPEGGQIDAARIAEFLGLPVTRVVRLAVAASGLFSNEDAFRAWLNAPHPDLDGASPVEVIAARKIEVVAELLEDASVGHPG